MKLHITNKDGAWDIEYESEPMPKERFDALITVAVTLIAAVAVLGLFGLLTR